MRRDFNDFEIAVGALAAFPGFCGFFFLVSLPELLGGLL